MNNKFTLKNGQNKCINCGSTEFLFDIKSGKLICSHCRTFLNDISIITEISELNKRIIGNSIIDIKTDDNYMTFKCETCGSEVGFNTIKEVTKKCPFCRSVLSINMQIENGVIPDMVLPFKVIKEQAVESMKQFINERKFFADKSFIKNFNEVEGIYLPYVIVDVNTSVRLYGQGEIQSAKYIGGKNDRRIYYDADLFYVKREFDLIINDLTVEANLGNLDYNSSHETNNIINSILPFDTENCVKWNANYLSGYSFEKRDLNIDKLSEVVNGQVADITHHAINDTLKPYNRGVHFKERFQDIKGEQWLIAYLPVYTYTYVKNNKKYFIAVNGRTKETMGSIPINSIKLSLIVLLMILLMLLLMYIFNSFIFVILSIPIIVFVNQILGKYGNKSKRHKYEKETETRVTNLVSEDQYVKSKHKLTESFMLKSNNNTVKNHKDILTKIKGE